MRAFLDLEQPHFHTALCGYVLLRAALAEITVITEPSEQAFLAYVLAVLLEHLCKLTDED